MASHTNQRIYGLTAAHQRAIEMSKRLDAQDRKDQKKLQKKLHEFYHFIARDEILLLIRQSLMPEKLSASSYDYPENYFFGEREPSAEEDLHDAQCMFDRLQRTMVDQHSYEFEQTLIKYINHVNRMNDTQSEMEHARTRSVGSFWM